MDKEEKKEKSKAEEIAEIMVANMIANMKNPNFIEEKERRLQEAAKKANAELLKRETEIEASKEKQNS
jgi:hypothetical protein